MSVPRRRVAVLGATGVAGQQFLVALGAAKGAVLTAEYVVSSGYID